MKKVNENKIKFLEAFFTIVGYPQEKKYECKLYNHPDEGITIKAEIPLFQNDHLFLEIKYGKLTFFYEGIITISDDDNYITLNLLSLSKKEQENLDALVETSLRKRF